MTLEQVREQANLRLEYAARLIGKPYCKEYNFVPNDGWTSCDFAGYVLVTRLLIKSRALSQPADLWSIYIQDADDGHQEKFFDSEEDARREFEEIFGSYDCFMDREMERELRKKGYY